jgi:hypothetical protein
MRHLLLLVLLFSAAFALYPIETGYSAVEFNITASASGAEVRVHVPTQSSTQYVIQATNNALFNDSLGQYVLVTGPFTYSARIEVNSSKAEIKANPAMPLKVTGMSQYLSSTTKIFANDPEIAALASGIASGKGTELEAAAAVVSWVNDNVRYVKKNETDVYSVKTAREVFDSREGYCGEYSVLAASMLRSLGIPTKYVIGYVYAGNEWLLHAWTEFYVPGSGWVPADPTYGQVGYLDATHVKISEGNDPTSMGDTVTYKAANPSYDKSVKLGMLNQSGFEHLFAASLSLSPSRVGFGSLSMATLTVENLRNAWATPTVQLLHSPELSLTAQHKILVIGPYADADAFWDISTPPNPPGPVDYEYSFFVKALGQGLSADTTLVASALSPVAIKGKLDVVSLSKRAMEHDVTMTIEIRNVGNINIEGLELSATSLSVSKTTHPVQKNTFDLAQGESRTISFDFPRVDGVNSYDFEIVASAAGAELLKQELNIKYEVPPGPEEELKQLLSTEQLTSLFIVVLAIIFLLIGALFLAPFLLKPKEPFTGVATLKHIVERGKDRYQRRRRRKEAAKRFDFQAEFEKKKEE